MFTEGRKREYIISPPFTDDELSTFTEDRKKIRNTDLHCQCTTIPPLFTDDELSTFTEDRKNIRNTDCDAVGEQT